MAHDVSRRTKLFPFARYVSSSGRGLKRSHRALPAREASAIASFSNVLKYRT